MASSLACSASSTNRGSSSGHHQTTVVYGRAGSAGSLAQGFRQDAIDEAVAVYRSWLVVFLVGRSALGMTRVPCFREGDWSHPLLPLRSSWTSRQFRCSPQDTLFRCRTSAYLGVVGFSLPAWLAGFPHLTFFSFDGQAVNPFLREGGESALLLGG